VWMLSRIPGNCLSICTVTIDVIPYRDKIKMAAFGDSHFSSSICRWLSENIRDGSVNFFCAETARLAGFKVGKLTINQF
jgi:hypothetical protein